jgi:predicted nuclease of predicted toxin-antitoxin system
MKLLIDNALSPVVAALLAAAGHDAVHVRSLALRAATDEVIFQTAAEQERVLV